MPIHTPAHKQTDPTKFPGQIVNHHDMMDDMADWAMATPPMPDKIVPAKEYRPVHGGYPDYNPRKEV